MFLRKYQALMRRKQQTTPTAVSSGVGSNEYSPRFHLPLKYDRRWRLNFVYRPNKTHMSTYDALGLILSV